MKNQKAIGEYTELQCITYLVGLGYTVSTPYGDNAPYDFILEVDNKLYKIQCKTAFVVDEGVWESDFVESESTVNSMSGKVILQMK